MNKIVLLISILLLNTNILFANTGEDDAIRGIIRYKANSFDNLLGVPTADKGINEASTVYKVYANNSYQQLWDREKIDALLKAVLDIRKDGLIPDDYHLKSIINLLNYDQAGNHDYPEAHADMDIILTDALSMLLSHIKFGKVDSEMLNYGWDLNNRAEKDKLHLAVTEALKSDDLYAFIESSKPELNFYKNLKKALSKIQFLKNRGGWDTIPGGAILKRNIRDQRVLLLRDRLIKTNHLMNVDNLLSDYFDETLEEAVKKFQIHHNLNPDGFVGPNTLNELNISAEERANQIKVNLERARWISDFDIEKNVIVNIAGFRVYYTENGKVVWSSRLQVGKPYRKTPIFKSEIKYLVFNPTWSVPPVILKNDILPAVKRDPSYLSARGFDVYNYKGNKVSPYDINWTGYSSSVPYTIRQKPGTRNALGRVKFIFPNDFSVYLHDTPNKHLFDRDIKTFSSGCIRVENPLELAELLLNDKVKWDSSSINKVIRSRKTRTVYLDNPVPIMVMYWTASSDNRGNIYFMNDVYGRDNEVLKELLN